MTGVQTCALPILTPSHLAKLFASGDKEKNLHEHITLLETTKPSTLAIIGEQSLQPANPPMAPNAPPNMNQSAGIPGAGAEKAPPTTGPLPGSPNLPQVPAEVLPNPELQAQALGNVQG